MRYLGLMAGTLLFAAAPAQAAVVLFDNFDGEAGGGTTLDYAGYTNFDVFDGTVDQIHHGGYGIGCAGGAGGCVDLDGSTSNGGTLKTKGSFSFNAGDIVTLSFVTSGNQRGGAADEFSYGFEFVAPVNALNAQVGGAFGPGLLSVGDFFGAVALASGRPNGSLGLVSSGEPFTPYSISFTAGTAGSLKAFVATASADNIGPILDNFSIDISAPGAIPEPATWVSMIAGFGLAGAAMRRRRTKTSFAAA